MSNHPSPTLNPKAEISDSAEVSPAINDNWQARRELAAALRRMNAAMLTADVPAEQLRAMAASIHADAASIEENQRIHGRDAQEALISARQQPKPDLLFEMSPVIGQSNAVSPAMHLWREGDRVHARVTPDWSYEGPSGHVQGGVIAMIFDSLLGIGQRLVGSPGYTGTLTVRYHHRTPLNKTLHLVAHVKRVEGRKKFMVAELWADELHTASCEGVFIMAKASLPPASATAESANT